LSAVTVLECSKISRDLSYLEFRTVNSPFPQSTSFRLSDMASEMRTPVAESRPMSASNVIARSAGASPRAAAINSATSASEYR
jgi:hypothetical protein